LKDRPWSRVEELLLKECRKEVTTGMMKVRREEAMGGRRETEGEKKGEVQFLSSSLLSWVSGTETALPSVCPSMFNITQPTIILSV
jgi:hypothetical protein